MMKYETHDINMKMKKVGTIGITT